MAELLALDAAAHLAVAAFSAAAAERDVAPELRALQLRVLAAATSVEAAGVAFERDARAAPLVRALAIRTPQGPMLELVAPYSEDTPVGRFIAKRGEGMHHVAYEVGDIEAEVARLVAEGVEMIDEQPRAGLFGLQVAFIHPEAVQGVLLELVQPGGSH